MREKIIEALLKNAEGKIEKHKVNVEVLLQNPMGVAEHSDTLGTIEKELKSISECDERIETINKHFVKKDPFKQ